MSPALRGLLSCAAAASAAFATAAAIGQAP